MCVPKKNLLEIVATDLAHIILFPLIKTFSDETMRILDLPAASK